MLYHYSGGSSPSQGTPPQLPAFCTLLITVWLQYSIGVAVGHLCLEVGALGCQGTYLAFRLGALANLLPMLLEQQVSPLSRFKRLWQAGIQDFPRGAVIS
jgi:hypothetical protein